MLDVLHRGSRHITFQSFICLVVETDEDEDESSPKGKERTCLLF